MRQGFEYKFDCGDKLRDMVTGLEGIVTGRSDYLNGCRCYCIKPSLDKDGKMQDGVWIDEPQLKLVKARAVVPAMEFSQESEKEPNETDRRAKKKKTHKVRRAYGGGPSQDLAPER